MPRDDGAGELRVAWRGGMMRRQRLRPGTKDKEHGNEHPGRDDHAPSGGKPIVTLRFGFGFDTFQHAITPIYCTVASRVGPAFTQPARGMAAMPFTST